MCSRRDGDEEEDDDYYLKHQPQMESCARRYTRTRHCNNTYRHHLRRTLQSRRRSGRRWTLCCGSIC